MTTMKAIKSAKNKKRDDIYVLIMFFVSINNPINKKSHRLPTEPPMSLIAYEQCQAIADQ